MKILQVMVHGSAHSFAGGTQKIMVETGNNLAKRGHQVTSIYNDTKPGKLFFDAENGAEIVNLSTEIKSPFHKGYKLLRELTRPLRNTNLSPYFPNPVHLEKARQLAPPVGKFIDQYKPDVIFAYGIQDLNSIVWGTKGSKSKNIPVLHLTHSDIDAYYTGLSHFDKKRIQQCSAVHASLPDFAKKFGDLLGRPVISVPNPVTPPTRFADLSGDKPRKRIMMHSRLDKSKQQHLLVEAFATIKDDFPDWDLAIFGGENTKGYLDKLKKIVQKNNMEERVSLNPPTPDVEKELSQSDLFAFPSLYEGWGLVLTEAMSVGLPCIGLKSTTAINYLIQSEDAGLVSENDLESFAQQLRTLMADDKLRQKYGENAKNGMDKYHADKICEQWEEIMDKMLNP